MRTTSGNDLGGSVYNRGRKDSLIGGNTMNIRSSLAPIDDQIDDPFARTEYQPLYTENVNLKPPLNLIRRNTDIGSSSLVRILLTGGPCAGKTTAIADIT